MRIAQGEWVREGAREGDVMTTFEDRGGQGEAGECESAGGYTRREERREVQGGWSDEGRAMRGEARRGERRANRVGGGTRKGRHGENAKSVCEEGQVRGNVGHEECES